jgi:hypothetical protein
MASIADRIYMQMSIPDRMDAKFKKFVASQEGGTSGFRSPGATDFSDAVNAVKSGEREIKYNDTERRRRGIGQTLAKRLVNNSRKKNDAKGVGRHGYRSSTLLD